MKFSSIIFFIYIISLMIISYFDEKYNLKSSLLFFFISITLLYLKTRKAFSKKLVIIKSNYVYRYVLLLFLSFSFSFSILPFFIFKDYHIVNIESHVNYNILKSLIISPILEELLFRRYLLSCLIKNMDIKKAILLSSFGFTVTHYLSGSSLFAVFILGILLAIVYVKTNNIILCIIGHSLSNFLAIVIFPLVFFKLEILQHTFYLGILFILSSIILLFSFFKIYKLKINT